MEPWFINPGVAFKPSSFTRVDELLKKHLTHLKIEETFQVYPIAKKWPEIAGEMVATKARPDYVRGKTLVVSVVNSVWMNELEMQKKSLLKKIREINSESGIEEIRFRLKKD